MSKTLHRLFLEMFNEKYFQHKKDSKLVIKSMNLIGPPVEGSDPSILVYNPLFQTQLKLSMYDLDSYVEISKEKVNKLINLQKENKELLPYWTSKTIEEIINSKWDNLNYYEQISQRTLQENPNITLEEATNLFDMLP
jgi:hypothetical protein